ncbi:efflux RND transporter periplasmic adaptor subunit [Pseudooceanicola atlanticus]|jgi:RND family efflux transporter MFP subunit|uniref:efflux RND transporter periplasmic adaptor subunit n=1 Tax=Pseudooceanicola atlanticus TaxID=1461694 RepID=UPI00235628B4|nr:efflux RND transporter periplasmic adaptor subunit [Pseudooceanicola atlanticus]
MRHVTLAVLIGTLSTAAAAQDMVDCVLEPASRVTITSSAEGVIRDLPVRRGDMVDRGDLLLRLDTEVEELQLELARTRAGSDVDVRAQQTRLSLREREFERVKRLSDRNVAATSALEDAEIELALTQLALEQAEFDRQLAGIEVRQAEALLARRSVLSPVSGLVVAVDASAGEYASEQSELMEIIETDPVNVEVFAPGRLFGDIAVGDSYEVTLNPPLEGSFPAEVVVVDRFFDAASGTFGVRLEVENPGGEVPTGARCRIAF